MEGIMERSLFGVYCAGALDGLGLALLGWKIRSRYTCFQGTFQILLVATGLTVELADASLVWVLLWLGGVLGVLASKYAVHRYLKRIKPDFSTIKLCPEYFSPEMYAYFVLAMLVNYFHIGSACSISIWGAICWSYAFGTTVVLLFMFGGLGLISANLGKPIRYSLRLAVSAGIVALILGCWQILF